MIRVGPYNNSFTDNLMPPTTQLCGDMKLYIVRRKQTGKNPVHVVHAYNITIFSLVWMTPMGVCRSAVQHQARAR